MDTAIAYLAKALVGGVVGAMVGMRASSIGNSLLAGALGIISASWGARLDASCSAAWARTLWD
jgi:hypothetical protein